MIENEGLHHQLNTYNKQVHVTKTGSDPRSYQLNILRWTPICTYEKLTQLGDSCCRLKGISPTIPPFTDTTKQALKLNPQGKRKRGRPAKTWRMSTEDKMKKAKISWNTAEKTAANRVRWRSIVDALCSTRSLKE